MEWSGARGRELKIIRKDYGTYQVTPKMDYNPYCYYHQPCWLIYDVDLISDKLQSVGSIHNHGLNTWMGIYIGQNVHDPGLYQEECQEPYNLVGWMIDLREQQLAEVFAELENIYQQLEGTTDLWP
jgi:hypothetical protein